MLKGYVQITRPVNSVIAGLAVLLGVIIASGTVALDSLVLIPVVALITAAGNVINDYFDREIDAVNRPERPIPSKKVSEKGALIFSTVLFITGILLCLFANYLCLFLALLNSFLLIAYAMKLKGMPLVGNLAVSYLSASIFLFGGAIAGPGGLIQNFVIAAITFFAMLSREMLKDAEDIEGDKTGGAKTLPMIIGVKKTGVLAFLMAFLAVFASFLPLFRFWGITYIAMISIADIIILYAAFRGLSCDDSESLRESGATGLLKKGMFLALLIFIISAVLIG
ncbi:geranylgeranylglycerol-phosphate geranylgeranyltransferase [Methanoplanus sp. FWC-SCC4]|uniref:Digeranylgeranylglyceryl phosphate synthase n=1 Tax=Methanochimaera problematica TaxID=2609417 RepID=A0AA97I384_9EURY|nr:geranylgeranylglycerol-phosphate geranylgeranyltransferase [Methanoplanus sp. FWC-SCC4]WOF16423.1 geranylgeranylglycerol-phosphate geranylgeranyltransferase [Methanoplanus sp. FWC-SCC4]